MAEISWHAISLEEVVANLNTDLDRGLGYEESEAKKNEFGKNVLPSEKPLSKLKILWDQLKSPLIYILVVAGAITVFFKEWADAIVIFGAVFLNTAVGFFQENKASKALAALKKIVKIKAVVIRDGNETEIDSEDLVPGDIIVISSGNKVPADGRIIDSHGLKINEAPLTGEWVPSEKEEKIMAESTPVADRDNMVYMGTSVVSGKGRAVVTATGISTEVGKVASMVRETKEEKTPLQKKLAGFSGVIGIVIAVLSVLIFIGGVVEGKGVFDMFMTSIAVAVAAIPEGLPVAMTVILAIGMQRILRRQGLVRKLVAAEILGGTSIIATDKTLTLTEGKMAVDKTVTFGQKIVGVEGKEWADVFKSGSDGDQALLVEAAAICSEALVENPSEAYPLWRVIGGPTDRAMLLAGAQVGLRKHDLEKAYLREDEVLFNSNNKYIASLVSAKSARGLAEEIKGSLEKDSVWKRGGRVLFVAGAPERMMAVSAGFINKGKERKMSGGALEELNSEMEEMTSQGLRVVGVAYKRINRRKYKNLEDEVKDLVFIGFMGLRDPLRPDAKKAIAQCEKAGLRPIMATGDHLLTAKAVGAELGLKTGPENVISGSDLDKLSDEEFAKRVGDIDIYSRVEPRHKMKIVEAWQRKGRVVAMTGDGINDAPALKKADIGVALGSGTDVAKEVSDLILLTDNFNIIVAAIEEGRAIIDNIRKVITYLLSSSFTETILVGASILLGWPLPVTAVQILWINLIEDGFPGVVLAFEPKEDGILERKPEKNGSHLLTREMKVIIFAIGILTDLLLLGLLAWFVETGRDMEYIRTMMFVGLGIDSLFYIFACKNLRKSIWHINPFSNVFLLMSWALGVTALTAAIYVPALNSLLGTIALGIYDWSILIGLGVANIALIELAKHYFIVRQQTE